MSFAGLVLAAGAFAQDPAPPPVMENRLRLFIDETLDEDSPYRETRQQWEARLEGPGWSYRQDHRRRFRQSPQLSPAPGSIPPLPELTLEGSLRQTSLVAQIGADTFLTGGSARVDPTISKASTGGLFGGSGAPDEVEDSGSTPFVGPQLTYPVASDVTTWGPASWLPEGTSLHVYAKALFGSVEIFDTDIEMQLYSAGPLLLIPLYASDLFLLGASVSAGPAYLDTNVGNAVGFEGAAGLRLEIPVTGNFSFVTTGHLSLYASENVTSWGPGINFGLTLSW